MTGFGVADLSRAVARARAGMGSVEQELNGADSKLGDGDTGSMLARVVERMGATDLGAAGGDVGQALGLLGRATLSATGSSLGTLVATGLLAASRATKGQEAVAWSQVSALVGTARDAMLARGGAQLGDKTVLDGLDAVASAVAGQADGSGVAAGARAGSAAALARFWERPCRIGRARMFPEQSTNAHDPGMLALSLIINLITQERPDGEP